MRRERDVLLTTFLFSPPPSSFHLLPLLLHPSLFPQEASDIWGARWSPSGQSEDGRASHGVGSYHANTLSVTVAGGRSQKGTAKHHWRERYLTFHTPLRQKAYHRSLKGKQEN